MSSTNSSQSLHCYLISMNFHQNVHKQKGSYKFTNKTFNFQLTFNSKQKTNYLTGQVACQTLTDSSQSISTHFEAREIYESHNKSKTIFAQRQARRHNSQGNFTQKKISILINNVAFHLAFFSLAASSRQGLKKKKENFISFLHFYLFRPDILSLHFIIYSKRNLQLLLSCVNLCEKLTMFYLGDKLSFAMLLRHLNDDKKIFYNLWRSFGTETE